MGLRFGARVDDWIRVLLHLRIRDADECFLAGCVIGVLLGSYVGALPIPLDWDRPWQVRRPSSLFLSLSVGCRLLMARCRCRLSSNGRSRACTARWSATASVEASGFSSAAVLAGSRTTSPSDSTIDKGSSREDQLLHQQRHMHVFVLSRGLRRDGQRARAESRALEVREQLGARDVARVVEEQLQDRLPLRGFGKRQEVEHVRDRALLERWSQRV